jgi:hypothetical protein
MKSGQRLAEGDPTVPMMTVSTARTGATDINMSATKPSAARPSVSIIRMIHPLCPLHAAQSTAAGPRNRIRQSLTGMISGLFLPRRVFFGGVPPASCAR